MESFKMTPTPSFIFLYLVAAPPEFVNENDSVGGEQPSGGEKVAELSGQGKVCVCGKLGCRQEDKWRGTCCLRGDYRTGTRKASEAEECRLVRKNIRNLKLYWRRAMGSLQFMSFIKYSGDQISMEQQNIGFSRR
jgi:hypothetical protein